MRQQGRQEVALVPQLLPRSQKLPPRCPSVPDARVVPRRDRVCPLGDAPVNERPELDGPVAVEVRVRSQAAGVAIQEGLEYALPVLSATRWIIKAWRSGGLGLGAHAERNPKTCCQHCARSGYLQYLAIACGGRALFAALRLS